MTKRKARCYQDGPKDGEVGSTCLLPANHEGPHVWTMDDEIPLKYLKHPSFPADDAE